MDPQIKATLQQTIAVASRSGYASGASTYGTAANRSARVESSKRIIDGSDGIKRATTHVIIVEAEIGDLDRIWLPGVSSADTTLARYPAAVDELVDENGDVSHYEVLV